MKSSFDRRDFLKFSGAFASVGFLGAYARPRQILSSPLVFKSPSAVTAIAVTGGWDNHGTPFTGVPAGIVTAPHGYMLQNGVALPLLKWFTEFVIGIGGDLIANSVWDWWKNLRRKDQDTVVNVNNDLEDAGFTDYGMDEVRVTPDEPVATYALGHKDELNICAPFFQVGDKTGTKLINGDWDAMIEGPTAIGLALAERDWSNKKVSSTEALLPLESNFVPGGIQSGQPEPVVITTPAGMTVVHYRKTRGRESGIVSVSVEAGNKLVFGKDYAISWRT